METAASISVQRISTLTMKILGVIALAFACVAARGSGPYLPRGWKPDGPAFYLPSDIPKPIKEPVKEIIFSESEASGSDFLREYGPPKVQEVSQDISQQALPDVINEQLFIAPIVENNDAKEQSNVVTEVTEEKVEVIAEVIAADEPLAITEPQVVTVTESIVNIDDEEEDLQLKDETTTLASATKVDAVNIFGYLVEPTVAVVVPTEKIYIEVSEQFQNQIIADTVETQKQTSEQQQIVQSARQEDKSENTEIVLVRSGTEQTSTDVSNGALSNLQAFESSITEKANFDVISTVEENIDTVETEVKKIEEVVQNIPELIVSLEKEVQSQQAENIQITPAVIQDVFGSLDQAPEGFLEYGPPGFSEYGPPKEDLRDANEEKIPEAQVIDNFVRRRRFSPKFRSSRKSH